MQPAGTAIRQGCFYDLNGEQTIQEAIERLKKSIASKITQPDYGGRAPLPLGTLMQVNNARRMVVLIFAV